MPPRGVLHPARERGTDPAPAVAGWTAASPRSWPLCSAYATRWSPSKTPTVESATSKLGRPSRRRCRPPRSPPRRCPRAPGRPSPRRRPCVVELRAGDGARPAGTSTGGTQPQKCRRGRPFPERPRRGECGSIRRSARAFLIAEMSNSSLILSETRTPPVSSAAFQVRPQSLRSRVVAPSKPIRMLPNGSWAEPVNSKGTAIGLGDALDGQVAGDRPVVAVAVDVGRDEGDVRVLLALEEVTRAAGGRRAAAGRC